MFGFCRPPEQDLEYRGIYSRCCQHQRRHYGLLPMRFTSYESVLLLACAADANPEIKAAIPTQWCCRLRRAPSPVRGAADQNLGLFVSSMSMVLAATKIDDDIRDCGSIRSRLARWLLRNKITKAFRFFESLDPAFSRKIKGQIENHMALEASSGPIQLADYT